MRIIEIKTPKGEMSQWTEDKIRTKIMSDVDFFFRALVRIYNNQTQDEKMDHNASYKNGVGFSKYDAPYMTKLAVQALKEEGLTKAQVRAGRKILVKYSKQLLKWIEDNYEHKVIIRRKRKGKFPIIGLQLELFI